MRPVIITVGEDGNTGRYYRNSMISLAYSDAVSAAGGLPALAVDNRHPEDYFETTLAIEKTKLVVRKSYPYIPLFLSAMEHETDQEALTVLGEYKDAYRKARMKAYENVSTANFKDVVSMEILARTMGLTLDGFLREEYDTDNFSEESYRKEVESYLRMMSALVVMEEA